MMGGDAAMLVALADSLFLDIDPSAARGRVLLFLVVSFAPFLVVAPLIGPVIDRAAGGRRSVIQLVAARPRRAAAADGASRSTTLALFPLVFAALVLQKTYLVSKSALVPSVVRTEARARRGQLQARPDRRAHRVRRRHPGRRSSRSTPLGGLGRR